MSINRIYIPMILFLITSHSMAQDKQDEYITFNDRTNVVHGFYLGVAANYGEIEGISTYGGSLKMAYVANQQFEVGISASVFQSNQELITVGTIGNDLTGGILGAHLEPIFFSKNRVSLSFPLLIGVGFVGYVTDGNEDFDDDFIDTEFDNIGTIFAIEPGVNALFNLSRYVQLEAGLKYRITSNFDLATSPIENLNGFFGGVGIKVGIFNLGRNRYKQKI